MSVRCELGEIHIPRVLHKDGRERCEQSRLPRYQRFQNHCIDVCKVLGQNLVTDPKMPGSEASERILEAHRRVFWRLSNEIGRGQVEDFQDLHKLFRRQGRNASLDLAEAGLRYRQALCKLRLGPPPLLA